ncbi:TVP38/TMEM64 family protein [Kaarinaea lacus]
MKKVFILLGLIIVGFLLSITGLLDPKMLLAMAREHADQPWLALVLVLVQVVLFTFGLAGSAILWVAAALFEPLTATLILAVGATLGGVSAYYFSATLSEEWVHKVERSHIYRLLHKQDNFFALLAMRVMPAFPQGLFNYSSGILKVNLVYFVVASFLGIGLKSYIYAQVIYEAAGGASVEDLLDYHKIGPLVLLSLALFAGVILKYKWDRRHGIPTE